MSCIVEITMPDDMGFVIEIDMGMSYEHNLNTACGVFHVWDKSIPWGDDEKKIKTLKSYNDYCTTIRSMRDLTQYFEDEFNSLGTCLELFGIGYDEAPFYEIESESESEDD